MVGEALEGEGDPLPKEEVKEEMKLISELTALPPFLASVYNNMKDNELAVLSSVVEAGSLKGSLTVLRYHWIHLFLTED